MTSKIMEKINEIRNLLLQIEEKLKELKDDISQDEVVIFQDDISSVFKIAEDFTWVYLKYKEYRFTSPNSSISANISNGLVNDIKSKKILSLKLKQLKKPHTTNGIIINSEVVDVTRVL